MANMAEYWDSQWAIRFMRGARSVMWNSSVPRDEGYLPAIGGYRDINAPHSDWLEQSWCRSFSSVAASSGRGSPEQEGVDYGDPWYRWTNIDTAGLAAFRG